MKRKPFWVRGAILFIAILLSLPVLAGAQGEGDASQQKLSKEELAQLLAPIALYPDELVAQILMASTYPLEIVQADRWAKSHKQSAGEVLAKQLEKENWDPSVKSLVNFPVVLAKMSEKLELTTKIGDAFLAQQKDVMDTIQELRRKAYEAGNLKTTKEQKVIVEKETIVIQPANPEVVYVPSYSPTVVYGTWMYPAYPPYYYYPPPPPPPPPPPGYPPPSMVYFSVGVAIGAAYSHAYPSWHGGTVVVAPPPPRPPPPGARPPGAAPAPPSASRPPGTTPPGGGAKPEQWKHDPSHRKGVAYKDGATAKKFGQSPARSEAGRREARGYGDARGGGAGARPSAGTMDRGGRAGADRGASPRATTGDARSGRDSAFSGGSGNGRQERMASDRGLASRQSAGSGSSFGSGGGGRSGGFGGGASRGGGFGGGRGGGR
ncbi:MAG TPA: DUF3300 domain-containing protein, partial [Geobacteraceae bacterium]